MSALPKPLARPSRRARRGGFGLVEVVVAMGVMTVSVLAMLWSTSSGARLSQQTQAYSEASFAVARVHERLRGGTLDATFQELRADPEFADGTLDVEVRFPEAVLLDYLSSSGFAGWGGGGEDEIPAGWRYRDLDDDGEVELDPAATATASLLPVEITARWAGGELQTRFMVTQR